jgi:hypothetical protein
MAHDKTLRDLETILVWEGEIDNARIREVLDVKPVWASRLISELMQYLGSSVKRDSAHAPLKFAGQKFKGVPDDYLRIVGSSELIEDARLDISSASPAIFSKVIQAIRKREGLRITYRSMTNPLGTERIVFPHVMVRVSRRWHVRAWCDQRKEFRDFTLGRITSLESLNTASPIAKEDDREWSETENVSIIAHPALSTEQQDMIRAEYFQSATAMRLVIRRCLIDYILRDLHVATDPKNQLPPEYQLAVTERSQT